MIKELIIFPTIYILGELLINKTYFPYLKNHFESEEKGENGLEKKFLGLNFSTFKGLLERMILYFGLAIDLSQVLIVFGTIKIGTKFGKDNKIKNDYFIVGNLSSILISILYFFIYKQIMRS